MTDLLVSAFPLDKLIPHPANPRRISPARLAGLRRSLSRHGDLGVIVAASNDDGTATILSGHQRAEVLRQAGHNAARVMLTTASESRRRELLLALNGHAGEWDEPQLAEVLRQLREEGQLDAEALALDATAERLLAATIESLAASEDDDEPVVVEDDEPHPNAPKRVCPHCGGPLP